MKRIFAIIGNVILGFLIIVGVFVGVTLLPIKNNFKLLAVMSGSMEPTIHTGSLAVIKPASDYRINDIVTFKKTSTSSDAETTTHKIQSISEINGAKVYTMKGDANNTADSQTVTEDQIVGKYRFSIALLGYLLKYLKTLPGLILIIVIPATVIIYEEARKIGRELRQIKLARSKKLNISPNKRRKNGKISK